MKIFCVPTTTKKEQASERKRQFHAVSSEQLQKSSQVFIDIHNFLPLQVSKTASVSNVTIIRERSSSSKLKAVIVIVVVSMHTKINAIAPICPLPSSFIALRFNCNQMFSYKANNKIK